MRFSDALLADEHAELAAALAMVRQGKSARLLQNLALQLSAAVTPAQANQRLTRQMTPKSGRNWSSRGDGRPSPPSQIPACGFPAPGSSTGHSSACIW